MPRSPFGLGGGFHNPLGAASDSLGNVWVSNSWVVEIPCATDTELQAPEEGGPGGIRLHGTMSRLSLDGTVSEFGGPG